MKFYGTKPPFDVILDNLQEPKSEAEQQISRLRAELRQLWQDMETFGHDAEKYGYLQRHF